MRSTRLPFIAGLVALSLAIANAAEVRLRDGTILNGEVVSQSDSTVVLKSSSLGKVSLSRAQIAGITYDASGTGDSTAPGRRARSLDPSGQALFFLPTAFTPAQGTFTFRDFELFFLSFGFSPTNSTSLSFGFFFPVSSDFQLLTLGAKQQLWRAEDGQTAVALTGNFTKPIIEEADIADYLVNSNLIVSHRVAADGFSDAFGFHGGIGYTGLSYSEIDLFSDERTHRWEDNFSFGGGMEIRLGRNAKFMVEYLSAAPFDPAGTDFDLLTIGVRLHSDRLSADIAGFRPLVSGSGGGGLFPLLNVGYRF